MNRRKFLQSASAGAFLSTLPMVTSAAVERQRDFKEIENRGIVPPGEVHAGQAILLYLGNFSKAEFGRIPVGFQALIDDDVSPGWGVDRFGFLRTLLKLRHNGWWETEGGIGPRVPRAIPYDGFLTYLGPLAGGQPPNEIADGQIGTDFKKTPDEEVSLSLAARVKDEANYYAVRFRGSYRIELIKVSNGREYRLGDYVTRTRYPGNLIWRMELEFRGPRLTGRILDEKGVEQSRVDAIDSDFLAGAVGLRATAFAAVRSFLIATYVISHPKREPVGIARENAGASEILKYSVVSPPDSIGSINTQWSKVGNAYDVVVAGAGTGGWAAAVQAARLGASVLLVEESDWIGGQMSAAGVTSMDESGVFYQFPVRERGIYREFNESIVNYFYGMDKDPFRAYYAVPTQLEGGYEPRVARAILYGFISETRRHGGPKGGPAILDVCLRTKVVHTHTEGAAIRGVTLEHISDAGEASKKYVQSNVLVEATEYGDVLPLTGARYRVGTSTSDRLNLAAPLQDNTWTAVVREYPEGIPAHLRIDTPPPGYAEVAKRLDKYQLWGDQRWKSLAPAEVKPPLSYRVLFAWRGMADSLSPMTGMMTEMRHTLCGQNGGEQDYPVTVAAVEDSAARIISELDGINRTLSTIYYFQKELGLPWSVAEDQGYDTLHNRRVMAEHGIRPDLLRIAVRLPQWPYVRESRRGIGVYTLRAADLSRFANAKLFPTSVAMGDYFMDLHGTADAIETDLDSPDYPKGGGPFQVPLEVFIPEKVDGLVFAEKNISQSRLVSGATRLQPSTMLTGQAAGTIAALAARHRIQPRQLNPIEVQTALLGAGSTLIQRWYADIPWGTPLWRATQLLSLYGVMDQPGPITPLNGAPLRGKYRWGVDESITLTDYSKAMERLTELIGRHPVSLAAKQNASRSQFALAAASLLASETITNKNRGNNLSPGLPDVLSQ